MSPQVHQRPLTATDLGGSPIASGTLAWNLACDVDPRRERPAAPLLFGSPRSDISAMISP